jgi:glutamyl-tRNA synthetase
MQHIGGVRTALFNYLFARSRGGKFLLRLEDTDRTRYGAEYEQNLFDTLDWLGIAWDEGPDKGGPYAPYIQSQRFDLYRKHAFELVEKSVAYHCFCDVERLERIRTIQTMNKMPPGYDRACRSLTGEEVAANLAAGKPSVIRLKVPLEGVTRFTDAILGDIEWKNEDVNPDPVLLKSDGFPTYHLANIVDDHFMKITHVMRAQEWVPSTPLHVLMYQAFGWVPPTFCHLPMVMGSDGQKLSKRHGATSVNEFRSKGYLPQAIVNYIAMVGASYEEGRDMYPLDDLERLFSLEHLNKAPAVFDYKKLEWFNGQYIRLLEDADLAALLEPFLEKAGLPMDAVRQKLPEILPLIKERLHFLTEAPEMVSFLFKEPAVPPVEELIPKKLDRERTKAALEAAIGFVQKAAALDHETAEQLARDTAEKLGLKLGDFMMPIRLAVTGSRISPPLIGSLAALGADKAVARVQRALAERF